MVFFRGTKHFEVEISLDERSWVTAAKGTFRNPPRHECGSILILPMSEPRRVKYVRVVIYSFHGYGAALQALIPLYGNGTTRKGDDSLKSSTYDFFPYNGDDSFLIITSQNCSSCTLFLDRGLHPATTIITRPDSSSNISIFTETFTEDKVFVNDSSLWTIDPDGSSSLTIDFGKSVTPIQIEVTISKSYNDVGTFA